MKARRASASVKFIFENEKEARAIYSSIKPEELLPESAKCRANIARRKNVLCLEVDAKDTAALRAALNSFLRWTIVARDVIKAGRD